MFKGLIGIYPTTGLNCLRTLIQVSRYPDIDIYVMEQVLVRDLLRRKGLGVRVGELEDGSGEGGQLPLIPPHGVAMFKLSIVW